MIHSGNIGLGNGTLEPVRRLFRVDSWHLVRGPWKHCSTRTTTSVSLRCLFYIFKSSSFFDIQCRWFMLHGLYYCTHDFPPFFRGVSDGFKSAWKVLNSVNLALPSHSNHLESGSINNQHSCPWCSLLGCFSSFTCLCSVALEWMLAFNPQPRLVLMHQLWSCIQKVWMQVSYGDILGLISSEPQKCHFQFACIFYIFSPHSKASCTQAHQMLQPMST